MDDLRIEYTFVIGMREETLIIEETTSMGGIPIYILLDSDEDYIRDEEEKIVFSDTLEGAKNLAKFYVLRFLELTKEEHLQCLRDVVSILDNSEDNKDWLDDYEKNSGNNGSAQLAVITY